MKQQRGQAFILVLILLAVGGLVIVPVLDYTTTGLRSQQISEDTMLEAYAADSGVQDALCELNNNLGAYTGTPFEKSFTINDRIVTVTATYVGGGIYKITSTATSANGGSTTIECDAILGVASVDFAVATKEKMELDNTTVDSFPDPGGGNIHSNANIILTGCSVNGTASANGTITGQEQVVTGNVWEYSPEIAFPDDYSELYMAMAQDGGTHPGNMVIDEDQPLGPLYISGNLTIENSTVILKGTVYVTGDIRVEGSNLDGNENIVAEGDIWIEQGAVRSAIIPIILCIKVDGRIYSEGRPEGPTIVDGVLYAPYGEVMLAQEGVHLYGVHLYGAVYGKTVDIQGSTITFARELLQGRQGVPGSKLGIISYSYK